MVLSELISITQDMWGGDAEVLPTKVDGIYDTTTARHGGYLVDTRLHPKLRKYGEKTFNSHIRAFEEDYEALKVLWLYPQLLKEPEKANEWLNEKTVTRFDEDDKFLKEFPTRRIILNEPEEEETNGL